MLYKIGEFADISGVSIRTLRYYDEIDLFKPTEVDLFTNYRYYKEEQLEDLKLINILKNIGFTLEEIKNNWDNFTDDVFVRKKQDLILEIEKNNNLIKQVDELRSKIVSGKIITNKVKEKVEERDIKIKKLY